MEIRIDNTPFIIAHSIFKRPILKGSNLSNGCGGLESSTAIWWIRPFYSLEIKSVQSLSWKLHKCYSRNWENFFLASLWILSLTRQQFSIVSSFHGSWVLKWAPCIPMHFGKALNTSTWHFILMPHCKLMYLIIKKCPI